MILSTRLKVFSVRIVSDVSIVSVDDDVLCGTKINIFYLAEKRAVPPEPKRQQKCQDGDTTSDACFVAEEVVFLRQS